LIRRALRTVTASGDCLEYTGLLTLTFFNALYDSCTVYMSLFLDSHSSGVIGSGGKGVGVVGGGKFQSQSQNINIVRAKGGGRSNEKGVASIEEEEAVSLQRQNMLSYLFNWIIARLTEYMVSFSSQVGSTL
jgi:hypothetical protein